MVKLNIPSHATGPDQVCYCERLAINQDTEDNGPITLGSLGPGDLGLAGGTDKFLDILQGWFITCFRLYSPLSERRVTDYTCTLSLIVDDSIVPTYSRNKLLRSISLVVSSPQAEAGP